MPQVSCRLILCSVLAWSFPAVAQPGPLILQSGYYLLPAILILLGGCVFLFMQLSKARAKAEQLSFLMRNNKDAVCLINADLVIQQVNPAFETITGFDAEQAIKQPLKLFNSQGEPENIAKSIQTALLQKGFWHGDIWSRKANQHVYAMDLSISCISPSSLQDDAVFVATFADISARKMSELELRRVNTKDPVTRLPNRAMFLDYLEREFSAVSEQTPQFAIIILQLAALKKQDDQTSLPLQEIASTIRAAIPAGMLLARLSTTEFAIVLPSHLAAKRIDLQSYRLASQLISTLQHTDFADYTDNLNPAIGIALYPEDGHSYDQLLRSADHALQRAQAASAQSIQLFNQALLPRSAESFALEQELKQAVAHDELRVTYQAKLCVSSNRVTGFEALVRWQHPTKGLLAPSQFLSIAEESDCIIQLDHQVLHQVCQQVSHWQKTGMMRGRLALNISCQTFYHPDFLQHYQQKITEHGLTPDFFELELDQAILAHQPDLCKSILTRARESGFQLVLDRFGSGLSALHYLRDYPLDQIKIDGKLVQKLEQSELERNLTASIIRIAGYLQLGVVANQVENEMQAYLLHVMGCETVQGHVFSKAVLPAELAAVIAREARTIQNKALG